jgi:hypothetical protein
MAAEGPDLLTSIRAEIGARLGELRPLLAEYERLLSAAYALAAEGRSAPAPPPERAPAKKAARPRAARPRAARPRAARPARKRERAPRDPAGRHGAAGEAILAAVEHGSHTVAELVVVTALPASDIRDSLRRLRRQRAIVKTDRDGRAAYALPD